MSDDQREPLVQFFKDGDAMGIRTTLTDPGRFVEECAMKLASFIESGLFRSNWEFQLSRWLPQMVEIACKLKGYKADVTEQRMVTAGDFGPPVDSLVQPTLVVEG